MKSTFQNINLFIHIVCSKCYQIRENESSANDSVVPFSLPDSIPVNEQSMQTHLVFVSVAELSIHHVDDAALVRIHAEPQLLPPGPAVRAADPCLAELLHHADVVNHIQDQGLQLQLQDSRLCEPRQTNRQISTDRIYVNYIRNLSHCCH